MVLLMGGGEAQAGGGWRPATKTTTLKPGDRYRAVVKVRGNLLGMFLESIKRGRFDVKSYLYNKIAPKLWAKGLTTDRFNVRVDYDWWNLLGIGEATITVEVEGKKVRDPLQMAAIVGIVIAVVAGLYITYKIIEVKLWYQSQIAYQQAQQAYYNAVSQCIASGRSPDYCAQAVRPPKPPERPPAGPGQEFGQLLQGAGVFLIAVALLMASRR